MLVMCCKAAFRCIRISDHINNRRVSKTVSSVGAASNISSVKRLIIQIG